MSTIGQRIRTIRKTNNLNQIKFANTIGISQGTLSELEQDKYRP
ncbi:MULTISPECIES: helix-turn-helix domain-containing protein [Paenibacillus]|nr:MULTISPECIES: helix-turn-helix transcriptional regulator [Paenibacillus]AUJ88471.1 XRE family transcriptional regulator [Paenibacillus polymyxa]POR27516.1 XRE family transcriptional regulator [Paenibacillus polymyxa]